MKRQSFFLKTLFFFLFVEAVLGTLFSEEYKNSSALTDYYDLRVTKLDIPRASNRDALKNGLKYNIDVEWMLYSLDHSSGKYIPVPPEEIKNYIVSLAKDSTFKKILKKVTVEKPPITFSDLKVGRTRYYVKVEGILLNGTIITSETKMVVHGLASSGFNWPIPMFFPVNYILRNSVFDNSTWIGQIVFTLLWGVIVYGIIIGFRCQRILHMKHIFPLVSNPKARFLGRSIKKDYLYELNLAPKVRFIIEAWKAIIAKNNEFITKNLALLKKDNQTALKNHLQLLNDSAEALRILYDLLKSISDPAYYNQIGSLLGEIKKYFGPNQANKFDADFITNGINISPKGYSIHLSWHEIESDFLNTSLPQSNKKAMLSDYPSVKILLAGIENHLNNIYDWEKASEEVDRAIENRSEIEIARLKEESKVEQLWNYGGIAPLLGLLGTVTGITQVFQTITNSAAAKLEMSGVIQQLAKGIYEALWTTILGLSVGIVMMFAYHKYKTNLEALLNKWASMIIHITEKL